ncbi:hypothetical protein WN51_07958 [Melipona quadrifasciata]|uniref:Mos1 transposase HTH domain-containing protein n=1 Tax=Melipona quadrifasciata TaxID=166423 RepID=A0A0M8ZPH9_9HYME|nr:hypothetical protein WN51_07958 [Melipona quadrifasciata]
MEEQDTHFRHISLYCFRKSKKASQAHKKLCTIYGNEERKKIFNDADDVKLHLKVDRLLNTTVFFQPPKTPACVKYVAKDLTSNCPLERKIDTVRCYNCQ